MSEKLNHIRSSSRHGTSTEGDVTNQSFYSIRSSSQSRKKIFDMNDVFQPRALLQANTIQSQQLQQQHQQQQQQQQQQQPAYIQPMIQQTQQQLQQTYHQSQQQAYQQQVVNSSGVPLQFEIKQSINQMKESMIIYAQNYFSQIQMTNTHNTEILKNLVDQLEKFKRTQDFQQKKIQSMYEQIQKLGIQGGLDSVPVTGQRQFQGIQTNNNNLNNNENIIGVELKQQMNKLESQHIHLTNNLNQISLEIQQSIQKQLSQGKENWKQSIDQSKQQQEEYLQRILVKLDSKMNGLTNELEQMRQINETRQNSSTYELNQKLHNFQLFHRQEFEKLLNTMNQKVNLSEIRQNFEDICENKVKQFSNEIQGVQQLFAQSSKQNNVQIGRLNQNLESISKELDAQIYELESQVSSQDSQLCTERNKLSNYDDILERVELHLREITKQRDELLFKHQYFKKQIEEAVKNSQSVHHQIQFDLQEQVNSLNNYVIEISDDKIRKLEVYLSELIQNLDDLDTLKKEKFQNIQKKIELLRQEFDEKVHHVSQDLLRQLEKQQSQSIEQIRIQHQNQIEKTQSVYQELRQQQSFEKSLNQMRVISQQNSFDPASTTARFSEEPHNRSLRKITKSDLFRLSKILPSQTPTPIHQKSDSQINSNISMSQNNQTNASINLSQQQPQIQNHFNNSLSSGPIAFNQSIQTFLTAQSNQSTLRNPQHSPDRETEFHSMIDEQPSQISIHSASQAGSTRFFQNLPDSQTPITQPFTRVYQKPPYQQQSQQQQLHSQQQQILQEPQNQKVQFQYMVPQQQFTTVRPGQEGIFTIQENQEEEDLQTIYNSRVGQHALQKSFQSSGKKQIAQSYEEIQEQIQQIDLGTRNPVSRGGSRNTSASKTSSINIQYNVQPLLESDKKFSFPSPLQMKNVYQDKLFQCSSENPLRSQDSLFKSQENPFSRFSQEPTKHNMSQYEKLTQKLRERMSIESTVSVKNEFQLQFSQEKLNNSREERNFQYEANQEQYQEEEEELNLDENEHFQPQIIFQDNQNLSAIKKQSQAITNILNNTNHSLGNHLGALKSPLEQFEDEFDFNDLEDYNDEQDFHQQDEHQMVSNSFRPKTLPTPSKELAHTNSLLVDENLTIKIKDLISKLDEQENPKLKCYVDEAGFLKDQNNYFLFDDQGFMIRTTVQELMKLENQGLVEII